MKVKTKAPCGVLFSLLKTVLHTNTVVFNKRTQKINEKFYILRIDLNA